MQSLTRLFPHTAVSMMLGGVILFGAAPAADAYEGGRDRTERAAELRERRAEARMGDRADLSLRGKHVAFLVGEGFHDAETYIPMAYLMNRGARVTVVGVEPAEVTSYNSDITIHVRRSVSDVNPDRFDALVIPGGESPDWLRQHSEVVSFAGDFFNTGKPVAAICHGPQVLITAGVLDGREATCFATVADELREAGATFEDEPVVRDGNLITSRVPDDIPAFSKEIKNALLE